MSQYDEFLKSSLIKYKNPDVAKREVVNVFANFNDLRPKLEDYVFEDDTRKSLLQLDGTIPVSYKGGVYNIPICIWLMDTHPYNQPMVYVKPTTSMHIKLGRNVDSNGKVDLPYLRQWRYPNSDLVGLIQILSIVFSEEPPVYSRPAAQQQQQYPADSPGQTPYPPAGAAMLNLPSTSTETEEHMQASLLSTVDMMKLRLKKMFAQAQYKNPDFAKLDVLNVLLHYNDLRPKLEEYVFEDDTRKSLLQLDGTIPVSFKGALYSIPICIWLMDTHPYNQPMVYVKPTTSMHIKHGRNVDSNGKVDLLYLREWRCPKSDLCEMIQILSIVFSEVLPVYSRLAAQQGVEETFAQAQYKYPDVAKRDVLNVYTRFNDLRPKLEDYVFKDDTRKSLLQLDGTIPVSFKGTTYIIPICIWLMDTHPYNQPMVYVKPTTSMHIKPGRNVDSNGKVDMPYLREWRYPNSDLLEMIQMLSIVFSEELPVNSSRAAQQGVEETFAEAQFKYPDIARSGVLDVLTSFNDLRPKLEYYVFKDDTQKSVLQLDGTIPVAYNGGMGCGLGDMSLDFNTGGCKFNPDPTDATYIIPICIWLMDTHPYNQPMVYVKPTTSMHVKPGLHVDSDGKVDLPYLREWRYPNSDLLGMIQILSIVFSEELPVYSSRAVQHQQRYPVGSPGQTPYPPAGAVTPNFSGTSNVPDEHLEASLHFVDEETFAQAQGEYTQTRPTPNFSGTSTVSEEQLEASVFSAVQETSAQAQSDIDSNIQLLRQKESEVKDALQRLEGQD